MTRSIGFATTDWARGYVRRDGSMMLGGAGHYRVGLPAAWLRDYGWEVTVGELGEIEGNRGSRALTIRTFDGEVVQPPDVMVLQRYMHAGVADAIRSARKVGQVVVNDLDDWFFGLDHRNQAARATDPNHAMRDAEERAAYNREHYGEAIGASSALTVSTPGLAKLLRGRYPKARVIVVRNAIDLARWAPRGVCNAEPVIGWVGATQFRSGDLQTPQAQAVGDWCNQEGLTFHHSGHIIPTEAELRAMRRDAVASKHWIGSAGEQLGVKRWAVQSIATIDDYPALFWPIDVGIVPLNDVPFNHSKSAIKLMEYAASGIPAVAQALPEQRWACDEVGLGRHARSAADWRRELGKMLDPGWRLDIATRARESVKRLDIASQGDAWRDVYERLLT